jgi:hypothetical protein
MGSTPEMSRHLRGEYGSLEELFRAGEAVQGLLEHPGWKHIMAVVDAEIATIDRELDSHREPLSQALYAMKHGRRGGLMAVEQAAQAILRRYEASLEEQRQRHESGAGSPQEV